MPNNNQSEEVERIIEAIGIATYGGLNFVPNEVYREKLTKILATHGASECARGKSEERERIYKHIVSEESRNAPYETEWQQGYLSGIDDVAKYIRPLSQENTLKDHAK